MKLAISYFGFARYAGFRTLTGKGIVPPRRQLPEIWWQFFA
jgi:hypothetical protein